jgi:putative FmdB family regulatory protein
MPTYSYKCQACDHTFDEVQSFSEPDLVACPACKKKKLQKLITIGSGFIFKGEGFYETDYRSSSYKEAEKKESTAANPAPACGTCGDPAGSCATPAASTAAKNTKSAKKS